MSLGLALAGGLAAVLAGWHPSLRLDASIRAEALRRSLDLVGAPAEVTATLLTSPRVAVGLATPRFGMELSYDPTVRAPDVLEDWDVSVIHRAELFTLGRVSSRTVWSATLGAERGTSDLVTESRRQADAPEPSSLPTTDTVRLENLRAEFAVETRLTRRVDLVLGANVFREGGAEPDAREVLPRQVGGGVETMLTLTGGGRVDPPQPDGEEAPRAAQPPADPFPDDPHLDRFGVRLTGSAAKVERGARSSSSALEAIWRRRLGRTWSGWVVTGGMAVREDPPLARARWRGYPTGELGVGHRPEGGRLLLEAVSHLTATPDRLSGLVRRQVDGVGQVRWRLFHAIVLSGRTSLAFVRDGADRSRLATVDGRVAWSPAERLSLSSGCYVIWQRPSEPTLPRFRELGVLVALELSHGRTAR